LSPIGCSVNTRSLSPYPNSLWAIDQAKSPGTPEATGA
jgi:hypothetical protein